MIVEYDEGTPAEVGVYACRVGPLASTSRIYEDIFLLWDGERWCYLGSDLFYRAHVPFFVGPLRRRMPDSVDDLFADSVRKCTVCNAVLTQNPSGWSCANGHGFGDSE